MAISIALRSLSKLNHISVIVIIALVIAFTIVLKALCLDTWYTRRRRNGFDHPENGFSTPENTGLDKETLDALPIAQYKAQNMNEDLECVVCLSKFEENEKIRVLPNCNHSFHTECINMWLHSHTTCPLCRKRVPSKRPHTVMSSSTRREDISSNIDVTSESVVRGHLVRGQRSSSAVQHSNPVSVLMLVGQAFTHPGLYAGRPVPHTAVDIRPY